MKGIRMFPSGGFILGALMGTEKSSSNSGQEPILESVEDYIFDLSALESLEKESEKVPSN